MRRRTHILAFLLLAVFAVGTVTDAAMATRMSVGMAVADAAVMDCSDCGEKGNMPLVCEQACVQSSAAIPVSLPIEIARESDSTSRSLARGLVGRTGPPERHPPR